MDSSYLATLYKDFETKLISINKYLERLGSQSKDIKETTYEWIEYLGKKNKILTSFRKNKIKSIPNTQFSVEPHPAQANEIIDGEQLNDNIGEVETNISQTSKEINYRFMKVQKDIQFLVTSYNDLQSLINTIYDSWEELNKQ